MIAPVATYRLQFRDGMTFAQAKNLASYLAELSVSHLYASPLLAAESGSAHGYDGIDFTEIEPALGGEEGFADLANALDRAGLHLLLDFVPNHMAASEHNRWWRSVLEWGRESPRAAVFDIDWQAPRLLLPVLGAPYGEVLAEGGFRLSFDPGSGTLAFGVYDRLLPLHPPSYAKILARIGAPDFDALASRFAATTPEGVDALRADLVRLARDAATAAAIDEAISAASADTEFLHEIHEAQVWRLGHWRLARDSLTYRRFFEIADLVCLRVEDPDVFAGVHARLFEMIDGGRVAGVRLDHIDGLADPAGYLRRLRQATEATKDLYLLVEKILEPGETLPADWPVDGTTGYEFIAALAGIFVDRLEEAAMTAAYDAFVGRQNDYAAMAQAAKKEIFEHNLAAELAVLTDRAAGIAATDLRTRDFGRDTLRRAIVGIAAALPVYRTYVADGNAGESDRALIARAAQEVRRRREPEDAGAVDFVARLLSLDVAPDQREGAAAFTTRFQQTTGPVMAKAIEDTMFYRFNRLIALNEVGGSPAHYGAPQSAFHAAMKDRQRDQSGGLSASATHDTKRGEDARARLYVLSEMPEAWSQAVARWSEMTAPCRADLDDGPAPDRQTEWLFYQALAGAWPTALISDEARLREENRKLCALRDRMRAYMLKAVREAKTRTSWTAPDPAYEDAVDAFVDGALDPARSGDFLADFIRSCRPVWVAGAVNALSQLAVKLFAPGVPDIYQGAELWDFSLVDPDNRAPVDFARRARLLDDVAGAAPEDLIRDWRSGAPKMAVTAAGLRARGERTALFAEGDYGPLDVAGPCARHVVAFARTHDTGAAMAIVPRFALSLMQGTDRPLVPARRWGDTAVALPPAMRGRVLRDSVTGAAHAAGGSLRVADVLDRFPVGLLTS